MTKRSVLTISKLIFVFTLLLFGIIHTFQGFAQTTQKQTNMKNNTASTLPNFKWPYSSKENGIIKWSSGPHSWSKGGQLTARISASRGNGLDFAKGGESFDVLSMASGTVIKNQCGFDGLGCIVAIRHDVGGSVMIYAHLKPNADETTPLNNIQEQTWYSIGTIVGEAGQSGGQDNIHLHIELRDGAGSCYAPPDSINGDDCGDVGFAGNPVGWDGKQLVDGYYVSGYFDSENACAPGADCDTIFNYDGSASKGSIAAPFLDFPYDDNGTPRVVLAFVHPDYICTSTDNCEINTVNTMFAGQGKFSGGGGVLRSTNGPVDPVIPTPIPSPNDDAIFIADITIPDETIMTPGESLFKIWRMKNTGSTTWGSGYQLTFVGGEQMGASGAVSIPTTAPGNTADISVPITAPSVGGVHTGYWQLRNLQGTYFGPRIWVQIEVQTSTGNVSLSTSPPSPSNAETVRIHASTSIPNFRAMRIKVDGDVVHELGAPQFYYDWNTIGYSDGGHSIVVEAADWTDLSWQHAEKAAVTYTLLGGRAPANHAPDRPALVSPYDFYLYYPGENPQLCAQGNDPDGDGLSYYFEIYDSPQAWNSGWAGSSCTNPTGLDAYTYKWRVKVRDTYLAESEWSEPWHFTIADPELSITELYFEPLDVDSEQVRIRACTAGQAGVGITMRVSVNDASDGSADGGWHIIKELGVPCFNEIDAPIWNTLEYGDGPHLVRVEAHGSDVSWDGAAVRQETYTLPHRRPDSAALESPVPPSGGLREAVYSNSRTVMFRWVRAIRADSYTLHVGSTPSPKDDPSPIFRQTFSSSTTEVVHTFGLDHPELYWQVTTDNDVGSNASGDQLFGIDQEAPSCSVDSLTSIHYEDIFQISWTGTDNLSGLRGFDIQYRDSERTEWAEWLVEAPSDKPYELFTGKPGHTYFFRCRARDTAGNIGDYPASADTSTTVDPSARPPTPWWDQAYAAKRNLILQNNEPSRTLPADYPVHLRFDAGTTPSATELYAASLSANKCDDLRIVYDDVTEIDRVVKECSSSAIDIWFRSKVNVTGGETDSSSHQLYYGNASATSPPADPNQVWYPNNDTDTTYLYFFQEGAGSTAYDSSGNGRNCSIDASVQWAAAKFGEGLRFNRSSAGDSRSLNCGSAIALSSFTIEFWYRPDADDGGSIAGELAGGGNGGGGSNWLLSNMEGKIRLDIWPCSTCGSAEVRSNFNLRNNPYVGEWNHIAVTFNGSNEVKFYINGSLDSTKYLSQSGINTFTPPLEIGSAEGIRQIKANMGAFRISNGVKTSFPYGSFADIRSEPSLAAGASIDPPETGSPDLVVLDVQTYPYSQGGVLVEVLVENQGDLQTQNGFYTDVYLDHLPDGPGDYLGSLRFWVNDPIGPGETATLSSVFIDLTATQAADMSGDAIVETQGRLYAQVDSAGVVTENDEDNNIFVAGTDFCTVSGDGYESDDDVSIATPAVIGQSQTHNFDRPGDTDWVQFEAQESRRYRLKTYELALASDTTIYLYAQDGTTLLVSNDDYEGTLASQIDWTAPSSATYYVKVNHWNPNVGGCGTSYSFVVLEMTYIYFPYISR
jgi:murein DD-endopeptidase MepM/ murein hydrolase activator NlpD